MTRKITGITVRSDGRLMLQFTVNGKRCTVYGHTVRECREKELRKRQELEVGTYRSGKALTVSEYCERWLENKAGSVKETTTRTDRILLSRINKTIIDGAGRKFGDIKLTKVEAQNVRDLQTKLSKEVSTRTTNDCIHLLKAVYRTAIEERICAWNPVIVKPLKRTEEAARDTIHRALTMEETAAFLEMAKNEGSWYLNLYTFLLNTGCRIGEAGALTQADLKKGAIRITKTVTRTEAGGYEIGKETKTAAGTRTIPLNADALKAWEGQREINAALYGDRVINLSEPVFKSPRGALIMSSSVNADICRICRAAGMQRFSVHAFRDTFATRCVESGMQVKTLQEIMGHTDINMTLGLYAHAAEDVKEQQIKAVNFI